jgi:7-carboxy-7-deazaguanine synthase
VAVLVDNKRATGTFPVIEVFGPTIQGEGADAGRPCYFIRLGGCDFRCSWCDTMYAVDPAEVRANAEQLTSSEISRRVEGLEGRAEWVVISGGNPALHELGQLVERLQAVELKVAVETQGSVWKDWLAEVNRLTVSPKPPSSGMDNDAHRAQLERFMEAATTASIAEQMALKIVCFDEADVRWAKTVAARWPQPELHLSAGTPIPYPPELSQAVGESFRWLCEQVARDPELARARVLPQLHVIAWGDERGV